MKYCSNCVMPDTKPGIVLDENGKCSACNSVEQKQFIDWDQREGELAEICDAIRGKNKQGYDCIVPVSGGKDSCYQAWTMKTKYNMKVLGVCIVPHLQTREGIANINNLVKNFNIDLFKVSLKPTVFQEIRRRSFFEMGEPNWADHCSTFAGVAQAAAMYEVPLVVWGEDIAVEFGGTKNKRVSSAENLIKNDLIKTKTVAHYYNNLVNAGNTFFYRHPSKSELNERHVKSIYLGYYSNWDGKKHYEISKSLGFKNRKLGPLSGNYIDYDNIDEKLCEINIWFKFLKFGFWRPTDQCCYQIWNRRMDRDEAVKIVNDIQYKFPKEYIKDFLEFHNITFDQFWETVDRFRNRDIWHKENGNWRLKYPLRPLSPEEKAKIQVPVYD